MKTFSSLRFLLIVVLCCGLLAGCSTTPSTSPDEGQVGATDVSQQGDVAGVGDARLPAVGACCPVVSFGLSAGFAGSSCSVARWGNQNAAFY